MKKLSILIVGLMILGVSACRKVTNEYYTTPNQTIYTTLNANQWVSTDGGKTYSADINFLNSDIYQNDTDGALVYISFDGTGVSNLNSTYESIPQTYDGFSYSYIVTQQKITIQIQNSSGTGTINPPGTTKIKVVMIASQN